MAPVDFRLGPQALLNIEVKKNLLRKFISLGSSEVWVSRDVGGGNLALEEALQIAQFASLMLSINLKFRCLRRF